MFSRKAGLAEPLERTCIIDVEGQSLYLASSLMCRESHSSHQVDPTAKCHCMKKLSCARTQKITCHLGKSILYSYMN